MNWKEYLEAGMPCKVCNKLTGLDKKWNGEVSKTTCLCIASCNGDFCEEHRHPENHACKNLLKLKEYISKGYSRYLLEFNLKKRHLVPYSQWRWLTKEEAKFFSDNLVVKECQLIANNKLVRSDEQIYSIII
jgi:hypothetical protein